MVIASLLNVHGCCVQILVLQFARSICVGCLHNRSEGMLRFLG